MVRGGKVVRLLFRREEPVKPVAPPLCPGMEQREAELARVQRGVRRMRGHHRGAKR